jgi:hypothetical protein
MDNWDMYDLGIMEKKVYVVLVDGYERKDHFDNKNCAQKCYRDISM